MKYKLENVRPNPFRDLEFNGFDDDTIAGLIGSITDTGFWSNIVGREAGSAVEIAYGHHRIEAARRLYGEEHEVDIAIADIDDQTMLKMMIAENVHQRGTAAANEFESARAFVRALADGKIALGPEESNGSQVRLAPSFVQLDAEHGVPEGPTYSTAQVRAFFGWSKSKVSYIFGALELDELGVLALDEMMAMSTSAVRQLVESSRTRMKSAEESERKDEERLEELEEKVVEAEPEEAQQLRQEIQQVRENRQEHRARAQRDVKETAKVVKKQLEEKSLPASKIKDVAMVVEMQNNAEEGEVAHVAARYVRNHRRRLDKFHDDLQSERMAAILDVSHHIVAEGETAVEELRNLIRSMREIAQTAEQFASSLEKVLD